MHDRFAIGIRLNPIVLSRLFYVSLLEMSLRIAALPEVQSYKILQNPALLRNGCLASGSLWQRSHGPILRLCPWLFDLENQRISAQYRSFLGSLVLAPEARLD